MSETAAAPGMTETEVRFTEILEERPEPDLVTVDSSGESEGKKLGECFKPNIPPVMSHNANA